MATYRLQEYVIKDGHIVKEIGYSLLQNDKTVAVFQGQGSLDNKNTAIRVNKILNLMSDGYRLIHPDQLRNVP